MPEGTNANGEQTNEGSAALNQPPAGGAKAEPPKQDPPAAKAEPPKQDPPAGSDEKEIDADGEIPSDAKLVKLSPRALAARLDRHTKRELVARFGTDDVEKIKADLDELATFRQQQEEQRREALSEKERLEEDLRKEREAREKAEAKLRREQDRAVFTEYDRTAENILGKHVAPKHVKRAIRELKEHVLTLDDTDLEGDDAAPKVFDAWAKEFVKENPEFAAQGQPEPKKIPLHTGSDPRRPDRSNPDMAQKTPKPGQPNSMTKAEFLAYKRQRGLAS